MDLQLLALALVVFIVYGPCPFKVVTHLDQPALIEGLSLSPVGIHICV